MKTSVTFFSIALLFVAVLMSLQMLHHRHNESSQDEVNPSEDVVDVDQKTPPVSEPSTSSTQKAENSHLHTTEVAQTVEPHNSPEKELSESEIADLIGTHHAKSDWQNSGFNSISTLIETYYWSMREGDLKRWIECMSPRETTAWQSLSKGRTDIVTARLIASLKHVQSYRISSVIRYPEGYLIDVKHELEDGSSVIEHFAVVKTGVQWKIAGEDGGLKYPHHPGAVSRFEVLSKNKK